MYAPRWSLGDGGFSTWAGDGPQVTMLESTAPSFRNVAHSRKCFISSSTQATGSIEEIRHKKAIDDDIKADLKKALTAAKEQFIASRGKYRCMPSLLDIAGAFARPKNTQQLTKALSEDGLGRKTAAAQERVFNARPYAAQLKSALADLAARIENVSIMGQVQENIMGNCLCVLGDSMAMPIGSMLNHFRDEFEEHIERARARRDLEEMQGAA